MRVSPVHFFYAKNAGETPTPPDAISHCSVYSDISRQTFKNFVVISPIRSKVAPDTGR